MLRTQFAIALLILVPLARAEDKPKEKAKKPTITGTITFVGTPTFAKGTKVKVMVEDTSLADAPAVVIGKLVIDDPKKTPIPFTVEYDGDKVKEGHRYTMRVRIEHDGKLKFINDTSIPVITGKPTKDVKVPVIAVGK